MTSLEHTGDVNGRSWIDPETLTWDKSRKLGKGSFGTVYRGRYAGSDIAVKVVNRDNSAGGNGGKDTDPYSGIETHLREIRRLAKLNHPCILRYFGISKEGKTNVPVIVTEYARGGTLLDGLSNVAFARARLGEDTLLKVLRSIAEGLAYLHSKKFTHGDLKPENILISDRFEITNRSATLKEDARVMLADFGYSRQFESGTESNGTDTAPKEGEEVKCTPFYRAPETFNNTWMKEGLAAVDVYAFGLIIYELVMRKRPWEGELYGTTVEQAVLSGRRPDWGNTKVPEKYKELAAACWHQDPSKRPTSKALVKTLKEFKVPPPPEPKKEIWPEIRTPGKKYWEIDALARPAGVRDISKYYMPGDSINEALHTLHWGSDVIVREPRGEEVSRVPDDQGDAPQGLFWKLSLPSGSTEVTTSYAESNKRSDRPEGLEQ